MLEELKKLEQDGYVRGVRHKEFPITVFNYTASTQYERKWAEFPLLRSCRGLVVGDDGKVYARPFQKFFNYEEHQESELPLGQKIEITQKMDGSLLIVFRFGESVVYCTRGSFYSDQAIAASKLFRAMYSEDLIEEGKTYLFEYIAPENRIVVKYDQPNLVHLALLDTHTGYDLPRDNRFQCVETHEVEHGLFSHDLYEKLKSLNLNNEEGFVIRAISEGNYPDWRCKIKFSDYCRLHRILTNCTNISVWECLLNQTNFDEWLDGVPDEFYNFIKETKLSLENEFRVIESHAKAILDSVSCIPSRKDKALEIIKNHNYYSSLVFKMLDEQDYTELIWKMVRPKEIVKPFLISAQD